MNNRETLRNWLNENKTTPGELATKCGFSRSVVEHMVHDERHPDFEPRKMTPEYRAKLYETTKLEIFKTTPQMIAGAGINLEHLESWQRELMQWMADHNYNRARVEKELEIGQGSLAAYCREPLRADRVCARNRQKIYQLTGIEALAPKNGKIARTGLATAQPAPANVNVNVPGLDALVTKVEALTTAVQERLPLANRDETDDELLKRTRVMFYDALETFEQYKARPDARDKLRESVTPREASYLCALLNSLYAKDEFAKIQLDQPRPQGVQR